VIRICRKGEKFVLKSDLESISYKPNFSKRQIVSEYRICIHKVVNCCNICIIFQYTTSAAFFVRGGYKDGQQVTRMQGIFVRSHSFFHKFPCLSVLHDAYGRGDGGVGLPVPAQGPRLPRQGRRLSTPRHQGTLYILQCSCLVGNNCCSVICNQSRAQSVNIRYIDNQHYRSVGTLIKKKPDEIQMGSVAKSSHI
jgi:hypothetical protein